MTKPTIDAPLFSSSGTTGMPDATVMGTIGQHVFIGLVGLSTNEPFTVRTSAIGDARDWPTPGSTDARTKQSINEVLPAEYGKVTGIVGGQFYGYIFQQRAIHKVTYIGGDVVFSFSLLDNTRGCIDYNRYATAKQTTFFESEGGYHSLREDVVTDIGSGRVDITYTPDITATQVRKGEQTVSVNPLQGIVCFFSKSLVYNYETDQWSRLDSGFPLDSTYDLYSNTNQFAGIKKIDAAVQFIETGSGQSMTNCRLRTTRKSLPGQPRFLVDAAKIHDSTGISMDATGSSVRINTANNYIDSGNTNTATSANSRTGYRHFRNSGVTQNTGRFAAVDIRPTDTNASAASQGYIWGVDLEVKITGND